MLKLNFTFVLSVLFFASSLWGEPSSKPQAFTPSKTALIKSLFLKDKNIFKHARRCDLEGLKDNIDFYREDESLPEVYDFLKNLRIERSSRLVDRKSYEGKSALDYAINSYIASEALEPSCTEFIFFLVQELSVNTKPSLKSLMSEVVRRKPEEDKKEAVLKIQLSELILQAEYRNPEISLSSMNLEVTPRDKKEGKKASSQGIKPAGTFNVLTRKQRNLVNDPFLDVQPQDFVKNWKGSVDVGFTSIDTINVSGTNLSGKVSTRKIHQDYIIRFFGSYYKSKREKNADYKRQSVGASLKFNDIFESGFSYTVRAEYKDNTGRDRALIEIGNSAEKNFKDVLFKGLDLKGGLGVTYINSTSNKKIGSYAGLDANYKLKKYDLDFFGKSKTYFIGEDRKNYKFGVKKKLTDKISASLVREKRYEKQGSRVVDDFKQTSLVLKFKF